MDEATVRLPGSDLVRVGLDDLDARVESAEALLVSIGAPRLAALGMKVERPLRLPGAPARIDGKSFRRRVDTFAMSFE